MSLSSCKKHCAVGNTPKVPFILQRSPFHVSLYKKPLNPEAREERNARNSRKHISLLYYFLVLKFVYTLLLKKHLICKQFYSNSDSLYSLRDQVLICILEKAKFV